MSRVSAERVNVNLPKPLLEDLRRYVPRSQRSEMIARATARELRRMKFAALFERLSREPAWRSAEHPDLLDGPAIDLFVQQYRARWRRYTPPRREVRRG